MQIVCIFNDNGKNLNVFACMQEQTKADENVTEYFSTKNHYQKHDEHQCYYFIAFVLILLHTVFYCDALLLSYHKIRIAYNLG